MKFYWIQGMVTESKFEPVFFTRDDFEKMREEEILGFYAYIKMDSTERPDPYDYAAIFLEIKALGRENIINFLVEQKINK